MNIFSTRFYFRGTEDEGSEVKQDEIKLMLKLFDDFSAFFQMIPTSDYSHRNSCLNDSHLLIPKTMKIS